MAQRIFEPYEGQLFRKDTNANTYADIPIYFHCNIFDRTAAMNYQPVKGIMSDNVKRVIYTTSKTVFSVNDKVLVNGNKMMITGVILGEDSTQNTLGARHINYSKLQERLPKWMTLE